MTVLPFLDIKATPIRTVESPRVSRSQSVPRPTHDKPSKSSNENPAKLPTIRSSIPAPRGKTPKIRIVPRTDELLKQLPHKKTAAIEAHQHRWKPLVREPPDYDYLWEPVQREDIRHQYDFYVAPTRITASRPDEPYKMTTMFETEDRHYHNYKRARAMQQRQWNREHIQYTIYPYSQQEEREMYNKQIRSTLKGQMQEKVLADRQDQEMKNRDAQLLIEHERQEAERSKEKQVEKTRLLLQVTARNKELMQNKWEFDQWDRVHQWHVERAILADDPINWSKTLT